jgi:hypothetical protein
VQRLRELAWIDGRNLAIEYRWAEGRDERYAEIAAEFVRLRVDVIVTVATPATLAAKQATAVIPIVFVTASDPVGTGLVASLARPGGNVTGLANQISDAGGKNQRPARSALRSLHPKSGELRTSHPPSRRSRTARMHRFGHGSVVVRFNTKTGGGATIKSLAATAGRGKKDGSR